MLTLAVWLSYLVLGQEPKAELRINVPCFFALHAPVRIGTSQTPITTY